MERPIPSRAFWKTRALNYIWANKLAVGKAVPNPFTANTVPVLPVQTGHHEFSLRNQVPLLP